MDPAPWSRLPRFEVVYECRNGLTLAGFLKDKKGHRTVAPPLAKATDCKKTVTGVACGVPYPGWSVPSHHPPGK
jgi:hypothetical protein